MKNVSLAVRKMLRLLPGYQLVKHYYKKVIQTDQQWVRVVTNRETKKIVKNLNPGALKEKGTQCTYGLLALDGNLDEAFSWDCRIISVSNLNRL